jgi:hypothetical protein
MADESGTPTSGEVALEATSVVKAPRRRALWGVLAAAAAAAGALAISAGGDDALPTLPVALGASGRDDSSGAAASADAADLRMAWVTYVAGDGLPALGGEGPVYKLDGAVDEARVRALAAALELAGDPVHEAGYWHLQSDDAVLEVYEEGGGHWWYGIQSREVPAVGFGSADCQPGPAVDCAVSSGTVAPDGAESPPTTVISGGSRDSGSCTISEAEDGSAAESCVTTVEPCAPDSGCTVPEPIVPEPPADLPAKDEARQIALDLLQATGMDVDNATVSVEGPYDAWYVSVQPVVEGLPVSGWTASVSVGSKGAITNASGTLATPELLGDYPLIDTSAAIDRLNEQQQSYGDDDIRPLGAPGTASSAREVATLEAPASPPQTIAECTTGPDGAESCSGTGADGCFVYPPDADADLDSPTTTYPCLDYEEPEPVEVVLHGAELVLVQLPSFDGSGDSYLLSGYRFTGDDGHIAEVAAVDDESLAPTTTVPEATVPESEPAILEPGQTPEIGVGYYVDVNTHCGWFVFGDRWWATDAQTPLDWATPTEGGTFTLTTPDGGTFVGDYRSAKTADFTARGPAEELPSCD